VVVTVVAGAGSTNAEAADAWIVLPGAGSAEAGVGTPLTDIALLVAAGGDTGGMCGPTGVESGRVGSESVQPHHICPGVRVVGPPRTHSDNSDEGGHVNVELSREDAAGGGLFVDGGGMCEPDGGTAEDTPLTGDDGPAEVAGMPEGMGVVHPHHISPGFSDAEFVRLQSGNGTLGSQSPVSSDAAELVGPLPGGYGPTNDEAELSDGIGVEADNGGTADKTDGGTVDQIPLPASAGIDIAEEGPAEDTPVTVGSGAEGPAETPVFPADGGTLLVSLSCPVIEVKNCAGIFDIVIDGAGVGTPGSGVVDGVRGL
jgi:hypothetical protein